MHAVTAEEALTADHAHGLGGLDDSDLSVGFYGAFQQPDLERVR
jgi:hypothetical protein